MKRTSHQSAVCPVARSLDIIGDHWSLLIVRDVRNGLVRFSALRGNLGVAKNILTVRLRALVEHDVLETVPAADGSAYAEYALTDKGRALLPILGAIRAWGTEHVRRAA